MEEIINNTRLFTMESFPQSSFPYGSCITLGVFDGVHRGHQAVIDILIEQSIERNIPAIIFIIDPSPKIAIQKLDITPLTTLAQRTNLLFQYAYSKSQGKVPVYCIHIPFTEYIAHYSAHDFIEEVLIPFCSVRHIVLGEGACFGKDRGISLKNSVHSIEYVPMVEYNNEIISSTRIRSFIENGDMESATYCLGRYFSFSGAVVYGYRRGSTLLGFPTANITIPSTLIPSQGVYSVYVFYKSSRYLGVMNIGTNPTFAGVNLSLEVHIIDFTMMIYGEILTIQYCKKLRNEQHFTHIEELINQITKDITETKEYLYQS